MREQERGYENEDRRMGVQEHRYKETVYLKHNTLIQQTSGTSLELLL